MKRWQRVVAYSTFVLVGLLTLLAACGGDGAGPGSPTPTEEGRTVTSDDGKLTLEVPPGALDEDVPITITSVPLEELPQALQEVRGAGDGYRLEPDGLQFSEPVAVSLEMDRADLEDEPEDGITAYGLVSLTENGERELLNELATEATLGEETVVARGELSHFSLITRTKGSLVVSLEEVPRIQLVGATFKAKGSFGNGDLRGKVTLVNPTGTFLAFGTVSAEGDTFSPPHADLNPGDGVEGTGAFNCGQPGLGTYTLRGMATSVVEVKDQEPIRTPLTVTVDSVVECVSDELTPTPTPAPTSTPTPTEEPGTASEFSGIYPSFVLVKLDSAGHADFILMPSNIDLEVFQSEISIRGPDPWVEVNGTLADDGSFTATGTGTVAGFPNIAVTFEGTLTSDGLAGDYTMGAEGGLPTGQPITYRVEGQRTP